MNKKNAHLFLPLVQALIDGKDLQCLKHGVWEDLHDVTFGGVATEYRIKAVPEVFYNLYRDGVRWRQYDDEKEACTMFEDFTHNHPLHNWTMKIFKEVPGES